MPVAIDTTLFSEASYAVGVYPFSAIAIPTEYTQASLKVARSAWLNPLSKLKFTMEISFDNGVSWPQSFSATAQGGVALVNGLPAPFSFIGAPLPQPENPDREIRGSIEVIAEPATVIVTAGIR
jgi:hypothetical protein